MEKQKKFIYSVSGIQGNVIRTRFLSDVEVEIEAEKISQATEKIEQYLADNHLTATTLILKKIII